jgi:integrase
VALEVRDIDVHPNGTGQALIRRGKTDVEGQGRLAYLSRETVKWLKIWLDNAKISDGPIFRRLIGKDQVGGRLNPGSVAPIFKRVAQWLGIPERFANQVSGHSTRVGMTSPFGCNLPTVVSPVDCLSGAARRGLGHAPARPPHPDSRWSFEA